MKISDTEPEEEEEEEDEEEEEEREDPYRRPAEASLAGHQPTSPALLTA